MKNVFHAVQTFEIPARNLFCIAGDVKEGTVKAGMCLQIPFNSSFSMSAPIESVERAQTDTGTRVVLAIRIEEELDWTIWRGLNIGSEDLDVTAPSEPPAP